MTDANLIEEGWYGDDYLVILPSTVRAAATIRYGIDRYLPGHLLAGFRGWDDVVVIAADGRSISLPAVPLDGAYAEPFDLPDGALLDPDPRFTGRIKWHVLPLAFGGSADDDENLTWVDHAQHADLVVYWNDLHRSMTP